ncbi:18504_t:CDS:2, partial [Racocetra fulgida]
IPKPIISIQETLKENKEDITKEDKNPFIFQEEYNKLIFNLWINNYKNNTSSLDCFLKSFSCFLQPFLEKQEDKQLPPIIYNSFSWRLNLNKKLKRRKQRRKINLSRVKQMIKSVELIFSFVFTISTCLQKLYSTLIQIYNSLLNRKLSQKLEKKLAKHIESCKQLQLSGAIIIQ